MKTRTFAVILPSLLSAVFSSHAFAQDNATGAKTLACTIDYAHGGQNGKFETSKVEAKLERDDANYQIQKTLLTKDKRFKIYVWAVQPYPVGPSMSATPGTPAPVEQFDYTGIEIDDVTSGAGSVAGTNVAGQTKVNEDHARLVHAFNLNNAHTQGNVVVDCNLN